MIAAALKVWSAARRVPPAIWGLMAIWTVVIAYGLFAHHMGVESEKARTATAVIQDEVKVQKAQGDLNALAIKRLDGSIVHNNRIDERTIHARRQLDAVEVAPSGDAFADRLAALRAYRDVAVSLRNDILAQREDYLADKPAADAPGGVRASRPSYG